MNGKEMMLTACIFGALAVAIGAFGAHAIKEHLDAEQMANFKTASQYHFLHSILALFAGFYYRRNDNRKLVQWAGYLFFTGILLFSFPLYIYAAIQASWAAMMMPFGGVMLIIAWLFLGIGATMKVKKKAKPDQE